MASYFWSHNLSQVQISRITAKGLHSFSCSQGMTPNPKKISLELMSQCLGLILIVKFSIIPLYCLTLQPGPSLSWRSIVISNSGYQVVPADITHHVLSITNQRPIFNFAFITGTLPPPPALVKFKTFAIRDQLFSTRAIKYFQATKTHQNNSPPPPAFGDPSYSLSSRKNFNN